MNIEKIFRFFSIFIFFVLPAGGLFISCTTAPEEKTEDPLQEEKPRGTIEELPDEKREGVFAEVSEKVLELWLDAWKEEDVKRLSQLYWENAVKIINVGDEPRELSGLDSILKNQIRSWERYDYRGIQHTDPHIVGETEEEVIYSFEVPELMLRHTVVLLNRDGKWRIQEHIIDRSIRIEVASEFQAWADRNGDGVFDLGEFRTFIEASVSLIIKPHEVENPVDRFFDLNYDDFIDENEVKLARGYFFASALARMVKEDRKQALQLLDFNNSGRISQDEIESVRGFLAGIDPRRVERREAQNPLEKRIDSDGDGIVERSEQVEAFYRFFESILLLPHDRRMIKEVVASVGKGRSEIEDVTTYTAPEAPEQKPAADELAESRVAVVSIDSLTQTVDQETVSGLILFIENAFVNTNAVTVVDRKNIEQVIAEYEFQRSALADENTAVEIGKLANADVIVTGALSRVGGSFYLNIKVIDVETGEIVASSLADAETEARFLQMCNTAVQSLF